MSSPSLPVFLSRRLPSGLSSLTVLRQYRRSLFVTAAAARRAVEPHSNAAPSSTRTEHFYSPADAVVNGDDEKTAAQKRLQHESDLVLETLARSPEQRGATVYSLSFAASGAELPFTPMQRDQLRNVRNLEASAEDPHLSMLYRDIQENFFGEVRQASARFSTERSEFRWTNIVRVLISSHLSLLLSLSLSSYRTHRALPTRHTLSPRYTLPRATARNEKIRPTTPPCRAPTPRPWPPPTRRGW
uniref:Uncharacterized protein n=1 Tax=Corethron hystrix TaxID=216773 RepID=A0A7S1FQ23_9STRA|mmetsp:Transcript_22193/g.50815  ORF Transcript_22193/g.50815 Transcript_22193/m.50815 type:complete len:244 (+) Transcript_22193:131-862(+)